MVLIGMVLLCAMGGVTHGQVKPAADPRAQIGTFIAYGIELLQQKRFEKFIRELATPAEVKKLEMQLGGLETTIEQFEKFDGETYLADFKRMKEHQPVLNAGGTIATFELRKEIKTTIILIKKGNLWYLSGE